MLENLMVYIPTALKIAHAEDDLIRYVITRSKSELKNIKEYSRPERNLILQLKISMIDVSINLNNEKELCEILERSDKMIQDYKRQMIDHPMDIRQSTIADEDIKYITEVFEEEKKNI